MSKAQILAIDDDTTWLGQIPIILEEEAVVVPAPTVDEGIRLLSQHYFDAIILDLNFDGDERTGSNIFGQIKAVANGASIIVISGETEARRLIEVFNAGVSKFLPKPASTHEIRRAINEILEERARRFRVKSLIDSEKVSLVGSSRVINEVRKTVHSLIEADAKDYLITGESGTGKDVVAKYIAAQSGAKNYCPIHCGAISESLADSELFGHTKGAFTGAIGERAGAFEAAKGGFVFLDEIGEMPPSQQVKLLRVLQERMVRRVGANEEKPAQFRVIAATNRNLAAMVSNGTFREDLFYRISKEVITLPPLRERKEDIPELVEYFLKSTYSNKKFEVTSEALILLQKYSWPGNVRELAAVVDRVAARAENVIRTSDITLVLPQVSSKKIESKKHRRLLEERVRYEQALLACNFDRDKAAEKLGVSRATYFRRARELGLVRERRDRPLSEGIGG